MRHYKLDMTVGSYFFGFECYTYLWHLRHSEPIEWQNLRITVPKGLVARKIENRKGKNEIQIYDLKQPDQVDILFEDVDYHLEKDFELGKKYRDAGYEIIEKKVTSILGYPCIWIKSFRKTKKRIYKEDIFFRTRNILISFIGASKNRRYLETVVRSLRIFENPIKKVISDGENSGIKVS